MVVLTRSVLIAAVTAVPWLSAGRVQAQTIHAEAAKWQPILTQANIRIQ